MLLTFVGLIFIQARYVRINAEMIENQFNENVQRSLFQTVSLVEENEALEYLSQTLEGADYSGNKNKLLSMDAQNIRLRNNIDSMAENPKLTSEQLNRPTIRLSTQEHVVPPLAESITETTIDTDTTEEILEEIDAALETTSELVEGDEILENTEAAEVAEDDETIELIEDPYNFDVSTQTKSDETRRTVLGKKNILNTPTRNELLSTPENTLSSTLANTKISDIKQAISIGDRFRFQRELFRGNGEDMNKTLTYLNLLATLDEAVSFLHSKYGWTSDNETAEDFYQIVIRRFL